MLGDIQRVLIHDGPIQAHLHLLRLGRINRLAIETDHQLNAIALAEGGDVLLNFLIGVKANLRLLLQELTALLSNLHLQVGLNRRELLLLGRVVGRTRLERLELLGRANRSSASPRERGSRSRRSAT